MSIRHCYPVAYCSYLGGLGPRLAFFNFSRVFARAEDLVGSEEGGAGSFGLVCCLYDSRGSRRGHDDRAGKARQDKSLVRFRTDVCSFKEIWKGFGGWPAIHSRYPGPPVKSQLLTPEWCANQRHCRKSSKSSNNSILSSDRSPTWNE